MNLITEAFLGFGDGNFEFSAWQTPFENEEIDILKVAYSPSRPLLNARDSGDLMIQVRTYSSKKYYTVIFETIGAFRVLDEGGLLEFWEMTKKLGGRQGRTTFMVRNHLWTKESFIPFLNHTKDGWSYICASDTDCIEVLAVKPPTIRLEHSGHVGLS